MRVSPRAIALSAVALALAIAGNLATSAPSQAVVPTPPGSPTWVHTVPLSAHSLQVSWLAPKFDGGSPITDYRVQYRKLRTDVWRTVSHAASDATSIVVRGLTESSTYEFRVFAINEEGAGLENIASTPVAVGNTSSCAITVQGAVQCWGSNTGGQLGTGSDENSAEPTVVTGIDGLTPASTATSIAVGESFACAVMLDQTVECWGSGATGSLGDGARTDQYTPVHVSGFDGLTPETSVVSVTTGNQHACALTSVGTVWCWGYGYNGQMGDGAQVSPATPVLSGIDGSSEGYLATSISAGSQHTCAVVISEEVLCWGKNSMGQLGTGNTANRSSPFAVDATYEVKSVSAGSEHTCVTHIDGSATCWGSNMGGQLGDGSDSDSNDPVSVEGIDGESISSSAIALSAGQFSTCQITEDGFIGCWGDNGYGQLGRGDYDAELTPSWVSGLYGGVADNAVRAVSISAHNSQHVCAGLATGQLACWGMNESGELGDGTTTDRLVPTLVPAFTAVDASTSVSTGAFGTTPQALPIVVTAPTAPQTVETTRLAAESITVSWSAPASNGQGRIDRYQVSYRASGSVAWTNVNSDSGSARQLRITGLVAGKTYEFQVRAHNSAGLSAASPSVTATVASTASAPRGAEGSWARGRITVTWEAAKSKADSPVIGYVASCSSSEADTLRSRVAASARTASITARANGKYSCRVAALTAAGRGVGSARIVVRTGA
jgi:alpha-tubulin suppressor-like RCC1 family protein